MRVEPAPLPGTAKGDGWMVGWHRVVADDGSTVAYCPDATTAEGFLRAEEIRHYLVDRCQRTCQGREKYAGRLRHEPNCPAYDLGLIEKAS